jgi:hypothetical protein
MIMPSPTASKVVYSHAACIFSVAAAAMLVVPVSVAHAESCVTKHGSATAITRGFAEYESFLIIRQVTGNWPFQQDRISKPIYKCASDGALWTCKASAKVCRR